MNGNAEAKAGLPSAADLDAVAEEQKAKEATEKPEPSPLSTPPALAPVIEQPASPGAAPQGISGAPSFLTPNENLDWTDPRLDTSKKDSLGNEKQDKTVFGPKGETVPADVQTPEQRQKAADARELKMREHMADTSGVDSVGLAKGHFAVTPGAKDRKGVKQPDVVDRSEVIEAHPVHVGPRGKGVPQDSFHGSRVAKR